MQPIPFYKCLLSAKTNSSTVLVLAALSTPSWLALLTAYALSAAVPARGAVLASSIITYLGIMKLNMAGPGLTNTIKSLWGK